MVESSILVIWLSAGMVKRCQSTDLNAVDKRGCIPISDFSLSNM